MSFSDFRLVQLEATAPAFEPAYGTLWTEAQGSQVDENEFNYITLENKYFKGLVKEGDTIKVSISSVGNQPASSRPLIITKGTLKLKIDNAEREPMPIEQGTTSADLVLTEEEIAKIQEGADVVLSWKDMTVAQVELLEKQPEPVVEEEELTDLVVNGTFDTPGVIAPWKTTGGFQNQTTATNQSGAFTVPFFENWNPSAKVNKMYQLIENIPNGKYKLRIAAFVNTLADPNESQFVFANEDKVYLTTGEPTAYEVTTEVTDNKIEIGLEQTTATANWMGIDNVSLSYIGPKNQFIKELAKMNLDPKQSVKTKDALQAAYDAFVADETDENKEALKAAIAATKVSINSYKILETGILPDNSLAGWTCTTFVDGQDVRWQVNTWSTEGNSDGTGMVTPFLENWTPGDKILGVGEIFYTLPGLDPGIYKFSALIRAYSEAGNAPTGASLFAGEREQEFSTGHSFEFNNNGKLLKGIYDSYAMTCEVGEDGIFRFGIKVKEERNFNWMAFKSCKVAYVGAAIDEAAVNELAATMPEGKMNAEVKAAAEAAIATAKATPNLDNYEAAAKAIATAEASVAAYAKMKKALDDMAAVLENTNVYTAEAYKANFTDQLGAYEAGTVLDADAAAFTMGSRLTGPLPSILLSAWSSVVENVPYINTWSVEGNNDGTNYLTPFFEYWVGDTESLAENTITATMDVDKKGYYDVTAWVRVRVKNGVTDPATGIKLQVNNGGLTEEGDDDNYDVSVTTGNQVGTSQFYLGEFTTIGWVKDDLKLNIKFKVSADNNISWLAFKNVKFTFNKEKTDGITNVNNAKNANDAIYNLNGQKVKKTGKGLYIINGKKVVLK
jgi:hypothetical protein